MIAAAQAELDSRNPVPVTAQQRIAHHFGLQFPLILPPVVCPYHVPPMGGNPELEWGKDP